MSDAPAAGNNAYASEYTRGERTVRRRSRASRGSSPTRAIRVFYFCIASFWGFLVGASALVGILALGNEQVRPDGTLLLLLIPFAGIALVGGAVTAAAYRESRRRRAR